MRSFTSGTASDALMIVPCGRVWYCWTGRLDTVTVDWAVVGRKDTLGFRARSGRLIAAVELWAIGIVEGSLAVWCGVGWRGTLALREIELGLVRRLGGPSWLGLTTEVMGARRVEVDFGRGRLLRGRSMAGVGMREVASVVYIWSIVKGPRQVIESVPYAFVE